MTRRGGRGDRATPFATIHGMADVLMYTSDRCPYCIRAKRLLDAKGVAYEEIHIGLDDFAARQRIYEVTGGLTVPQVIIDGTPVGGYDEISALDRAGELDVLLSA